MKTKAKREIPRTLSIETYMHCGKCMDEMPEGVSPKDWQEVQVGFTKIGLQIWCKRHNVNICHIDFEGQRHPANTTIPKEQP